jgi:curved DNA-binding protein CbpA
LDVSRPRPINYYDILGVASDATHPDIRSAYLARIAEYHPDRNPTTHATAIAALVNEAWAVLGDAERRRKYDADAAIGRNSTSAAQPPRPGPARQPTAEAQQVPPAEAAVSAPPEDSEAEDDGAESQSVETPSRDGGFGGWLRVVRRTVSVATGNRRGAKRLKTLFTVSVGPTAGTAGSRSSARHTCLDLSPQGLAITTNHPIDAGTSLGVSLELHDGRVDASSTVVRCEPLKVKDRWKVAIEFIGLSNTDQRRIRDFVKDEARSRVG